MNDMIQGVVVEIIDGSRFDIAITHVAAGNKLEYDSSEHIQLDKNLTAKDILKKDKRRYNNKFLGENVRCFVSCRNNSGHVIINDIEVIHEC